MSNENILHIPANTRTPSTNTVVPAAYNCLQAALENSKSENIMWIDISAQSSLGEYFVLATARSIRHAQAIADKVRVNAKQNALTVISTEGKNAPDGWIVIDLGVVIVHIFLAEVRCYYNLEQLWSVRNGSQ